MKIIKIFMILIGVSSMMMLFSGCATSTGLQSSPIQYDESRGQKNDMPVIRSYNSLLLRSKPIDGAVKTMAMKIGSALNGITPAGVVASLGTSPERAFSELESGRRIQYTWGHVIDNPKGKDITYTVTANGLDSDSPEGANNGPQGQNAALDSFEIKIESTDKSGGNTE
jgi:hypothetical protein